MRKSLVAFIGLALFGPGLTGCGFRGEQREAWRIQAEEACMRERQVTPSAYMSRSSPIDGPGVCGISYPFKVAAFGKRTVGLTQRVTLGCPIIPRIDGWIDEVVQPAASLYFGVAVAEVKSGSYSCRPRNNQRGARLSEHSFGNALDVMAFRLADGREVTVVKGWGGAPEEQAFLREVFVGACNHFTTVLGPGSDAFHYDHFHLDLARHDPRGQRRVCKPLIKFEPRLGAQAVAALQTPRAPSRPASPVGPVVHSQPAIEAEEGDSVAVEPDEPPGPRRAASAPQASPSAPRPFNASPYPVAPARPQGSYEAARSSGRPQPAPEPYRTPTVLQPSILGGSGIY
jgi:hypothetical protein